MKKLLTTILTVFMLFSLVSCAFSEEQESVHPIEKFGKKLEEDNCSIEMTFLIKDEQFSVSYTIEMQVDGSVIYMPECTAMGQVLLEECYIKAYEDYSYVYKKNDFGNWIRNIVYAEQSSATDYEAFFELFRPNNYEKVSGEKNTYKQKPTADFDLFDDVTMTVTDTECTMVGMVLQNGVYVNVEILFSKIGQIDITLPRTN